MSNEEIERVMNFIIQRQEVFAQNQETAQADTRELKRSVTDLTARMTDLTARVTHLTDVVGELAAAQIVLTQNQERLQGDISNMLKITTGLFEIVVKDGGTSPTSE